MDQLPVFVYGTLRSGQRNRVLLDGRIEREVTALADGLALFPFGERFPFAAEYPGGTIVGDLMYLAADHYESAMADLDRLERYRPDQPDESMYLRTTRRVRCEQSTGGFEVIEAWLYVAGPASVGMYDPSAPIVGGDWASHLATPRPTGETTVTS